ncbi:MAG TPA: MFS transporter [Candidatus Saccharimonadales bacterium]|nr:MFS transporter [Candidatus Saccharimonadales bacterium]
MSGLPGSERPHLAGVEANRRRQPGSAPLVEPAPSTIGVLRNRRFMSLWLAQLATQIGGNMVLYGLTVLVFTETRLTSATSLLILTFLVPGVIFGAVAGVMVDRFDRRRILIATNVLRGIAFLAMVAASSNILLVYLLNIVVSTVTTFFAPAEAAMIPELVERHQLLQANTLFMVTLNGSIALGFALLGPILVSLAGAPSLIAIVGGLYLVAAVLTVTLPASPAGRKAGGTAGTAGGAGAAAAQTFSQLREGLGYIRMNPGIRWSLAYLTVSASLIGVLGALGPSFATSVLGLNATDFVVVVLPLGIGVVIGILALNVYGKYLPRQRVIEGGLLALAASLAVISIAAPFSRFLQHATIEAVPQLGSMISVLSMVIFVAVVAGVAYAFVSVPSQTELQEEIPPDVRGRVFGVLNTLVSIASFLPIILVGPLADLIGTAAVMLLAAGVVGITGIVSLIKVRPIDRVSAVPKPLIAPVAPLALHEVLVSLEPELDETESATRE